MYEDAKNFNPTKRHKQKNVKQLCIDVSVECFFLCGIHLSHQNWNENVIIHNMGLYDKIKVHSVSCKIQATQAPKTGHNNVKGSNAAIKASLAKTKT